MITYKISSDINIVKQLVNACYKHRLYWNMGMLIDYYKRIDKLNKIWDYSAIDSYGKEYHFSHPIL